MFPEPGEQGGAIGVFSFVGLRGRVDRPAGRRASREALTWHWIFFVNVPIGVGRWCWAPALDRAEHDRPRLRAGADVPGAVAGHGAR